MKQNHVSKEGALKQIAEFVLEQENDDYISWCEENDYDPKQIRGLEQSGHPYALALIGLGLEFEE